jgi:hypothetical protein
VDYGRKSRHARYGRLVRSQERTANLACAGRYYSVQFNDPSMNANFAYIGKRTTGTGAGEYLVNGPRWKGTVP